MAFNVLVVVSSKSQAEIFADICQKLPAWNVKAVNLNKFEKREDIERSLRELHLAYRTIPSLNMQGVKAIIKAERPDIVVLGHDRNYLDKLFIRNARSNRIPTLLVQDGIMAVGQDRAKSLKGSYLNSALKYGLSFPFRAMRFIFSRDYPWGYKFETALSSLRYDIRVKPELYGHGECSKMAVFGEATRRMLISEGISPERIVVTGNPKFDKLVNLDDIRNKASVCQKWNIPIEKDIVLLMTQYFVEEKTWSPEQRHQFVMAVCRAVNALKNCQLIIKLHSPNENEEDYKQTLKGVEPPPIICTNASLSELISACSLAMTVSSTTALEAMAVKKPVVIVNLFNTSGASFYKGSGALLAEREEDILPAMQKVLFDSTIRQSNIETSEKFVYEQASYQDGQASQRIADLMKEMVSRNTFHNE